ncbi:MAG: hypothetical protein WBV11_12305 [Salegentibacter sp.]
MGGPIEDKHHERKEKKRSDNDPLSGELGDRDAEKNDYDPETKTIKDHDKKK